MATAAARSTTERNKLIAAIVLGVLAIAALYFAFGRSLFSSSASSAKATPTPKASPSPRDPGKFTLPSADEQAFNEQTVPIDYRPGQAYAPDAGRNIFAFYEPAKPCPPEICPPTPPKTPEPPPITPAPTPPILASFITPQSVYAGSQGFRLEVNGDFFPPEARIYFNQTEMPTTFVNAQRLFTDIPATLISAEGQRQVIVQTPDGTKYSNQVMLVVQAPPRPNFQYVGLIARKRYNNDTAYFLEANKPAPFSARLNDVVGGRFRLINISATEVVFEDTSLGFKHRLPIVRSTTGGGTSLPSQPSGFPSNPGFPTGIPAGIPQDIPGIPNNIPRYVPPTSPNRNPINPDKKDDVDDDGDGYER